MDKNAEKAIKVINSLGNYGVIHIKAVPTEFMGLIEISKNLFDNTWCVGWNFNYGCPQNSKRFNTAEEVVSFLVENKIPIKNLFIKSDPCLFNGL